MFLSRIGALVIWLWNSWEAFGFIRALLGWIGGEVVLNSLLTALKELPVWQLALVSSGFAVMWFSLVAAFGRILRSKQMERDRQGDQNISGSSTGDVAGRDITKTEGDFAPQTIGDNSPISMTVNQVTPAPPKPHWLYRSGCPQFDLSPGVQNPQQKIGGDLHVFGANPLPTNIEAKWEGPGITMGWESPTPTVVRKNEQLAFHMGWMAFSPTKLDELEFRFNLRFWWDNEPHGATWIWYLVPHSSKEGAWERLQHKGSSTRQPKPEDTW